MTRGLTLEELNNLTRANSGDAGSHRAAGPGVEDKSALWTQVVATSHDPNISSRHLTSACNALCYLTRANAADDRIEVRRLAYSSETWQQLASVSSVAFMHGKNKPALQILETIVLLARGEPDREGLTNDIETLMRNMINLLHHGKSYSRHKEASIVILLFLRKLSHMFSFADLLTRVHEEEIDTYSCDPAQASQQVFDTRTKALSSFIVSLLTALNLAESKSALAKLLEYITTNHQLFPGVDLVRATTLAIREISTNYALQSPQALKDALPAIVTKQEDFYTMLSTNVEDASSVEAISVALTVMLYGRSKHYLSHEDTTTHMQRLCPTKLNIKGQHDEDYSGYISLLTSCEPSLRLQALRLLTFCASPKEAIPPKVLRTLLAVYPILHDDTDAFQRGELISIFRNILTRLQQSYVVLLRYAQPSMENSLPKEYEGFCSSFYQFLIAELAPSASYSRHILALQTLSLVFDPDECNNTSHQASLFTQDSAIFEPLISMLHDPFDDVRALSTRLLRALVRAETPSFRRLWTDGDVLGHASSLAMRTNRADHADALGRAIMLDAYVAQGRTTDTIELWGLARASEPFHSIMTLDALNTNSSWPLHGSILGLAYIISDISNYRSVGQANTVLKSILSISERIWLLTQPHLCVDSPETELDDMDEGMHAGPKDQLAYAWRALRDTNILMQSLLRSTTAFTGAIAPVGEMCFEQLARLRHRGAFSTVAQTFLLCCEKARQIRLQETLDHWLRRALRELDLQADKLTRRSAGLPAMFTAIIDPDDNEKFMDVVNHLLIIASEATIESRVHNSEARLRLPQVHALNCLKDIMTNSRLRARTESIILSMIEVACRKMTSNIWAIKNCGLMLLRACINRLEIRTSPMSSASMESSGLKGGLNSPIATALMLLRSEDHEAIFAGLDILGRLKIDDDEPEKVIESVTSCLGHPIWHVRAQAARLLATRIEPTKAITVLTQLFANTPAQSGLNYLHGCMLVLRNMLPLFTRSIKDEVATGHDVERVLSGLLQNPNIMTQGPLCSVWLEATRDAVRAGVITTSDFVSLMGCFKALEQASASTDDAFFSSHRALSLALEAAFDPRSTNIPYDTVDHAAAEHVLSGLQDFVTADCAPRVAVLAARFTEPDYNEHVRSAAMELFALCLRKNENIIDEDMVKRLSRMISFDVSTSRALFGAQLALFMGICVSCYKTSEQTTIASAKAQAYTFAARMQVASSDEVDIDCRQAALESLEQLKGIPSPISMINSLFGDRDTINLLCILYDLLNDDDEEIRNRASHMAMCFTTSLERNGLLPACSPIVSRQSLIEHILTQSNSRSALYTQAVSRLLNIKVRTERNEAEIEAFCDEHSTKRILDSIHLAVDDLFAEEKQNLYIDDVAEVQLWAKVAMATGNQGHDKLITVLESWVKDGLHQISDLLVSSRLSSGRYTHNWIFESQAQLAIVRAIVLGRTLAARAKGAVDTLNVQLESVRQECELHSAARMILKSFTWSLR